jgi:nucleotide-binding universal stress UspA family protein
MAGRIVVGIDGSEASQAALRWAVNEARDRGAKLFVVHAWTFVPPATMAEPGLMPLPAGDLAGELEIQRNAVATVLEESISSVDTTGVDLETRLIEDAPGEALVRESKDADLLVVGSHGHSLIGGALLGSVSRHVEKHAPCEVMIIRPPKDDNQD